VVSYFNVYEKGRAYGGPEEGGWWYDTLTPVMSVEVCPDYHGDVLCLLGLATNLYGRFKGDPCDNYFYQSSDAYVAYIEDNFARPKPERRPHYE
jgi:hypothetical protein